MLGSGRRASLPRSAAATLLILLGAAGFLLCVAGIAGCWIFRPSLSRRASQACERAEKALGVTADSLRQVAAALERARTDLDAIQAATGPADPRQPEGQAPRRTLARKLAGELTPRLDSARRGLNAVVETSVVLNSLLEGLDEIPLVHMTAVDSEQLRDVEGRLAALSASAQELQARLGPAGPGDETGEFGARMREALSRANTGVGGLIDRAGEAQARVAELRRRLPGWLTAAAVAATVLLFWGALGQLSLFVHGCSLYRGGSR